MNAKDQGGRRGPSPDSRLRDMGGDIGPAWIRGSGVRPGGQREGQAEPAGGYSEPMGYMAGRGPVDEDHRGEVEDDEPVPPGETARSRDLPPDSGHVSPGLDWVSSDEDDPDAGSGRIWE